VECLIAAPATSGIGGNHVPDAGFVGAQLRSSSCVGTSVARN